MSATRPLLDYGRLPVIQNLCAAHIFSGDSWVATHCHFPFDIFTQVSVKRSLVSKGFPAGSVPLALKTPVAMAVSPNAVTFTSSYWALSYLVAFAVASDSALPVTFPSLPVLMNLSASSGATRSGLFVFCD